MTDDRAVVHVVDDDEGIRKSLRTLLESRGYETREYANADEFLSREIDLRPGCIILDVRMPGRTGLELQKVLVSHECPIPILFLSGTASVRAAVTAIKKGAVEFLEKPVSHQDLLAAVEQATEISVAAVDRANFLATLTDREREVFFLVEAGRHNKEIAFRLNVSEKTVEFHKKNIRNKL